MRRTRRATRARGAHQNGCPPSSSWPRTRPHSPSLPRPQPPAPQRVSRDPERRSARVRREARLVRNEPYQPRGQDPKPRGDAAADVVEAHPVVDDAPLQVHGRELQDGADGRADRAAERVPDLVVEPRKELGRAVLVQVLRRPPVEVRVKLVDRRPELGDSLEPDEEEVEVRDGIGR
jgi:hypothetical protein